MANPLISNTIPVVKTATFPYLADTYLFSCPARDVRFEHIMYNNVEFLDVKRPTLASCSKPPEDGFRHAGQQLGETGALSLDGIRHGRQECSGKEARA